MRFVCESVEWIQLSLAVVTGFPQIGGSSQTDGISSYFFFIVTIKLDYLVWDVTLLGAYQAILWSLLSNNLTELYNIQLYNYTILAFSVSSFQYRSRSDCQPSIKLCEFRNQYYILTDYFCCCCYCCCYCCCCCCCWLSKCFRIPDKKYYEKLYFKRVTKN
jgi:hypothetical protein